MLNKKNNTALISPDKSSRALQAGSLLGLVFFSGCGRQEHAGGTVGTVSGALIGASVAGRNNSATGALIGGLAGHLVGSSIGRAADQEEADEQVEMRERAHARHLAAAQRRAEEIEAENRAFKEANTRWCADCRRQSTLIGAYSCVVCGGNLITELMCKACTRIYSPTSGYSCCPYCRGGIRLTPR
ncbi:hypothetical protein FJ365_04210 [Candidatus Dependentiae bacterium]|nr:hypothetical protein [Candidatus Dependentiae bacterium]